MATTKKLSPALWLKKAARAISEAPDDFSILRVSEFDDDGAPQGSDVDLDTAAQLIESAEPCCLALVDSDGAVISECAVVNGERIANPRAPFNGRRQGPLGSAFEKAIANQMGDLGRQWGDLAAFQGAALKERERLIEQLRRENDELKDQLKEAELSRDDGEGSEWAELIREGLEVFKGRTAREKIKEVGARILQRAVQEGKIRPEDAMALLPLINDEIASVDLTPNVKLVQ